MQKYYGYRLTGAVEKIYVRLVLYRSFYDQWYDTEKKILYTTVDEKKFQKICERAYCEKLLKEDGGNIYMTERECNNFLYYNSIKQITGKNGFMLLKQSDIPKLFESVGNHF